MPINPTAAGLILCISSTAASKGRFISKWPAASPQVYRLWCHRSGFRWPVPYGAAEASTAVLTHAVQKGEEASKSLLEQFRKREMVVQMQHGPVNAEGHGDCSWPLNRERLRPATAGSGWPVAE